MPATALGEPVDPALLARRLLYGAPETRQRVAQELLEAEGGDLLDLLASTVRSTESSRLRARCLEVLGLAAGGGRQVLAERILAAVTGAAAPDGEARAG
jgi:hypothetical protein